MNTAVEEPLPLRLILVASFGPLLLNLSATTVNVALDRLMLHFSAPLSTIQWVMTGYLLALALVLPAFRFALERLGSRRLYVGGLLAFTATSMLSAFAWSAPSLIAFRVLQGAVGGLLAPLTQALIAQLAGPKRMGRAVSIVSIPVLVAPLVGPVLGGVLIQHLSWRWLFSFSAPLGLAGAWLGHRHLPPGTHAARTDFDWLGFALLSPAIGLFTFAIAALGKGHGGLWPLAISVCLFALFVRDARRRPASALVDLRVFQNRTVGVALFGYLLTSFGTFGGQLLMPLFYQQVRGETAHRAGLLLAPQGLGMLLTLPQIGKLTDRFDHGKLVIAGVLTTLAGTLVFARATADTPYWLLSLALFVRGAGLGATNTPALAAAYKHLVPAEIPNATTAMNIVQRLGAPLGTAAMAMALARFSAREALVPAFEHAFLVSALLASLALVSGFGLVRTTNGTM